MPAHKRLRRHLLRKAVAAAGGAALAGRDRLSDNASFVEDLKSARRLSHAVHKAVAPANAMAQTAIRGRKGGCWEDEGYGWCAGI